MKDYKPDHVRAAIEKAGIKKWGVGRLGMPTNDDGIRLQLLGVPGGLAKTIIPSTRITTDDAAVEAAGLDHIVLAVTDLDRASAHYEKFFGSPMSKKSRPGMSPGCTHTPCLGACLHRAQNPPSSGSASARRIR